MHVIWDKFLLLIETLLSKGARKPVNPKKLPLLKNIKKLIFKILKKKFKIHTLISPMIKEVF
jgi:hypothetical protein